MNKKNKVNRVENKFYVPSKYIDDLKFCLSKIMLEDKYNKSPRGYKITSLYFDSIDDRDLNEKLDGIIYREKYRIRIYDADNLYGKFEIKRKLNQTIEKISLELSEGDIHNIISGNYSALEQDPEFSYASYRMQYYNYKPKTIVEYYRNAYYLPINNIRITIDSNLSNYGFKNDFFNLKSFKSNTLQNPGYEILEIKFNESIPKSILNILSAFPLRQSAISKYSLSRLDSNTESKGDNPLISF